RAGMGEQLRALGGALVVETGRAFATAEDLAVEVDPTARSVSSVAAMERFLADNLDRPLQVEDAASVVHLSTRHAARLFAAETGESVMAALRRLRLERGAHLLLDSDAPVAQVARACGYPEPRAVIAALRRRDGQPPGALRTRGGTLHPRPPPGGPAGRARRGPGRPTGRRSYARGGLRGRPVGGFDGPVGEGVVAVVGHQPAGQQ